MPRSRTIPLTLVSRMCLWAGLSCMAASFGMVLGSCLH